MKIGELTIDIVPILEEAGVDISDVKRAIGRSDKCSLCEMLEDKINRKELETSLAVIYNHQVTLTTPWSEPRIQYTIVRSYYCPRCGRRLEASDG